MQTRKIVLQTILLSIVFLIAGNGFPGSGIAARPHDPVLAAESVRSSLSDALHLLSSQPARSKNKIDEALKRYRTDLAADIAAADASSSSRIDEGFALAQEAAANHDKRRLAEAKSQIWTGILGASYTIVHQSMDHGDADKAEEWLKLREYRKTTRFSLPSTDATLAVSNYKQGIVSKEEAVTLIDSDLLDTYQGRLQKAVQDLRDASAKGFTVRMAENIALIEGYFHILAPAFQEQAGEQNLNALNAMMKELGATVRSGKDPAQKLEQLEKALQGFRAAPLSQEEKTRRAGQLMRFLSLVPVEYGRGVRNGHIVRDFEIVEAVTFTEAASVAFTDLQSDLQKIDGEKSAKVRQRLDELKALLNRANQQTEIASPKTVESAVDEISKLLNEVMPSEWLKQLSAGDLDAIAAVLDQMEAAVAQNDYVAAESARLQTYAILEAGPEPKLVAFAPQFIPRLEGLFWYGLGEYKGLAQLIQNQAELADIRKTRQELDKELANALEAIGGNDSPHAVLINSAIIVFREGLEAVLILAALLAGLQRSEYAHLRRPLWWGSIASLLATAATWILARELLLTLARYGERVEAVVSLMAVILLLLITNWFFHQSYWTD